MRLGEGEVEGQGQEVGDAIGVQGRRGRRRGGGGRAPERRKKAEGERATEKMGHAFPKHLGILRPF